MQILYIHGFNSSVNSTTYKNLKELFPEHTWTAENFDLTDLQKTKTQIDWILKNNHPKVIIASSLGAFYALGITDSAARIVINPCLKPSLEIPKLNSDIPTNIIEQWKQEEKMLFEVDGEVRECCFGIFGNHDELFSYKDDFDNFYHATNLGMQKSFLVEGGHHSLSKDILKFYIQKGFDYFHLLSEHCRLAQYISFDDGSRRGIE